MALAFDRVKQSQQTDDRVRLASPWWALDDGKAVGHGGVNCRSLRTIECRGIFTELLAVLIGEALQHAIKVAHWVVLELHLGAGQDDGCVDGRVEQRGSGVFALLLPANDLVAEGEVGRLHAL